MLDHLGKSSSHPFFISLGNIPNFLCQKPESKAIVGYLPVLKPQDTQEKNSKTFRKMQCTVFQRCLAILLESIGDEPDLYCLI